MTDDDATALNLFRAGWPVANIAGYLAVSDLAVQDIIRDELNRLGAEPVPFGGCDDGVIHHPDGTSRACPECAL